MGFPLTGCKKPKKPLQTASYFFNGAPVKNLSCSLRIP